MKYIYSSKRVVTFSLTLNLLYFVFHAIFYCKITTFQMMIFHAKYKDETINHKLAAAELKYGLNMADVFTRR